IAVMSATRTVDMMVPAVEAMSHRMDPAFELELQGLIVLQMHPQGSMLHSVFRTAGVLDLEFTGRQQHRFAAAPVDLLLEEAVRCQLPGLRWVNVAGRALKGQAGKRGGPVVIADDQSDGHGRTDLEQHG